MIVFVMGVSGSGKSEVGSRVAARLGWEFMEADAFHPAGNIAKMSGGTPLTDEDRGPWLEALAGAVASAREQHASLRQPPSGGAQDRLGLPRPASQDSLAPQHERGLVLACSGLRRAHRDAITRGEREDVLLVWLTGDPALIRERMAQRAHFMPVALIDSQLATLELPDEDEQPLVLDVAEPVEVLVERIVAAVEERSR